MVREVEPVPPLELLELVLLLSLLSLPQAATPNDSAASRQAEPARFRTRNVSPPQGIDSGESASLNRVRDGAQWSPTHTTRWKCGLTTVRVAQKAPEDGRNALFGRLDALVKRALALAPGRDVLGQQVDRERDDHQQRRQQERVQGLGPEGPEDQPEAERRDDGVSESHDCGGS